jgi:CPA1 family monovalent cation:H+ antiporter
MTAFDLAAIFLALVGLVGWLNVRFFHLPTATAMVLAGLAGAGLLLAARTWLPGPNAAGQLVGVIAGVDFPKTVLGYMLAFLLFAGAMQVSLAELRKRLLAIGSLATVGVLASTLIVGGGLGLTARLLDLPLTLPWAFVFGALISPTDPIAVLAAVRQGSLSKTLEAVLQGEALFNDGIGIVVFTAAVAIASGGGELHPLQAIGQVAIEAIGGLALGLAASLIVIAGMRAIDDHAVEVGLSIALAVGVYALADALRVSGPIAVVVAGLMVGNLGMRTAMSDITQRNVHGFWTLVDEILNALLFLLLGLELVVVPFDPKMAGLWIAAILLVVLARLVVVAPWGAFFRRREQQRGASLLLGWGGLHGALSLALALTLPPGEARTLVLSTTFAVVIFSVLAQGLTFGGLAAKFATRQGQ